MQRRFGLITLVSLGLMMVAAGCGENDTEATVDPRDAGARQDAMSPDEGFELRTTTRPVEAGGDVEWCEVLAVPGAPGEEIWIDRVQVALADRSHHANVLGLVPGSSAEASAEVGDVVDCVENGQTPFGVGLYNLGGGAGSLTENTFPEGVGLKLTGGQKIVLNVHFINIGDDAVQGDMVARFHRAPDQATLQEMRRFGMYNQAIVIPALSQASFTMACNMQQDVYIHELSRHTHRWGTRFNAWYEGGPRDGDHIFESLRWDADLSHLLDEPVLIKAGEGLRFTCDFDNTEDHDLLWGDTGAEEMCILYGRYFMADPTASPEPQGCYAMPGLAPDAEGVVHGMPCPTCP